MRLAVLVAAGLALAPAAGLAQTAPAAPPAAASGAPQTLKPPITRDQYIEYWKNWEASRAATRFDKIDTDHDGTIDAAEWAAHEGQSAHRTYHRGPPPAAKTAPPPPANQSQE